MTLTKCRGAGSRKSTWLLRSLMAAEDKTRLGRERRGDKGARKMRRETRGEGTEDAGPGERERVQRVGEEERESRNVRSEQTDGAGGRTSADRELMPRPREGGQDQRQHRLERQVGSRMVSSLVTLRGRCETQRRRRTGQTADHHRADGAVQVAADAARRAGKVRLGDAEQQEDDERNSRREHEAVCDVGDKEVGQQRAEAAEEVREADREGADVEPRDGRLL
jgi:hypothetical protein